jgi:cytochrome c oxidase assembly factor CtaG
VLGDPAAATLWALPLGARRAVGGAWKRSRAAQALWRALRHPVTAWTLHVVALWLWHLPRLYERALRDPAVHVLEHLAFFVTALLFWWVLADRASRRRMGSGVALLYLFAAALQSTALGAWMSFAREPWYRAHARTALAWGLTALQDQQIAGLIMWVPAGFAYLAAVAAIVVPLLREARPAHTAVPLPAIDTAAP